jgi:hypothetical protein
MGRGEVCAIHVVMRVANAQVLAAWLRACADDATFKLTRGRCEVGAPAPRTVWKLHSGSADRHIIITPQRALEC